MSYSPKSTIKVYAVAPTTRLDPFMSYYQNKRNGPARPPALYGLGADHLTLIESSRTDHLTLIESSRTDDNTQQHERVRWSLGGYMGSGLSTTSIANSVDRRLIHEWATSLKYEPGGTETLTAGGSPNPYIFQKSLPRFVPSGNWYSFSRDTYSATIRGCIFLLGSPYIHEFLDGIPLVSSHGSHIQAVNKFLSPIADRRNGLLTVDAVQYTEDALRNYQHTHGNVSQDEDEWAEALGENASLGDLLRLFVGLRDNQSQANVVGIWTGNRPRAGWNWIISRAAQIDPPAWAAHNIMVLADAVLRAMEEVRESLGDIYEALALAHTSEYRNLLDPAAYSDHNEFRFVQEVPFVRNYFTYPYLDRSLSNDDGGASTDPDYLFYHEKYEETISGSNVPEGVLPNRYIYKICNQSLGMNGGVPSKWDPPPADSSPGDKASKGREYLENYYKPLLTMQNSFVLDDTDESIRSYLNTYSDTVPALSSSAPGATLNRQEQMMKEQKALLVPAADVELLKDKVKFFPMTNTVKFQMESPGPATMAMNTVEVQDAPPPHQIRSIILDAIRLAFPGTSAPPETTLTTNNPLFIRALKSSAGNPSKASYIGNNLQVSKYDTLPLRRTPISRILSHIDLQDAALSPSKYVMTPLVLTERGLDVLTGAKPSASQKTALQTSFRADLGNIAKQQFLNYTDYLTNNLRGPATPSEALAYKIIKKNQDGAVMQEIYVANGLLGNPGNNQSRDRMFEYIDSQVKYDTSYTYDLYEYRIVYTTNYRSIILPAPRNRTFRLPSWMHVGVGDESQIDLEEFNPPAEDAERELEPFDDARNRMAGFDPVAFDSYSVSSPSIHLYEVPIYQSSLYKDKIRRTRTPLTGYWMPNGRYYTPTKILDYPPPPPDLTVYPLKGNYRQVKVGVDLSVGEFTQDGALRTIDVEPGDHSSQWWYQHHLEYFPLRRGFLQFKNESLTEIVRVKIMRTTHLNTAVVSYKDLYASFNKEENADVVTYDLTKNPQMVESELVASYDLTDDIDPNVRYYYTCVAYDVHGNVSNPSPIKEVRLVYDKGKCLPQIEEYKFVPVSRKVPTRKFTRYLQIGPSDIQSDPINKVDDDGESHGIRNLGSEIGKSIANKDFIVRLTSRDTGRKFDIKLSFTQRDINE